MQKRMWMVMVMIGLAGAACWQLGGCANLIPEQEVPFNLDSDLGEFQVGPGAPVQKTGTLRFDPGEFPIGRGSLEIDPSVISVALSDNGGNKLFAAAQDVNDIQTCLDACGVAGVDAARCANVCENNELDVTVWLGSTDEPDAVCEAADRFGPFRVTLDENFVPVSVTPASVTLPDQVIGLLESGELRVCIQVIAPIDGTVIIDKLIFSVGL